MLSAHLRVLYLHGFASTPGSRKARFFAERLSALGVQVEVPDLAEGQFERLTISGQLKLIDKIVQGQSVVMIGSSLGGYLGALYAAAHPEVARLLLLAPAFGFYELWSNSLGPERLRLWRESATMPIYHYGEQRDLPIRYDLIEDAAHYPAFPDFEQPALIFHGLEDVVVPIQYSSTFARKHENVKLIELRSAHELTDVLDEIWARAENFLLAPPLQNGC
jgi:pimeloyl-ACP methyl ester carboxylesterase